MDENEEPIVDSTPPTENNSNGAVDTAVNTAENVKKTVKNVKEIKKTANAAKTLSLAGPLMTILFWVFVVIIAIIIIVGLVMFFVTMPGMVMEKLKALAKEFADGWAAWFGDNKAEISVEDQDVYDVLDYLHQMGYDLKGFGFLTDYANSSDLDELDDKTNAKIDKDLGVIFNTEEDKIIFAESDFIFTYLVSENYMYTIKNFNLDTGWWSAIWDHVGAIFKDNLSKRTGMLVFYHDDGTVGGTTNDAYDAFERGSIEIDAKTKQLKVTKGWTNGTMTFSLDGWTGRYGMPLDFLLSVHMATLMPDLAYDMADSFQTEIKILLHEVNGSIRGTYKNEEGKMIRYAQMSDVINLIGGEALWSSIIRSIDEWGMSKEEAEALFDLGIIPPNHEEVENSPCGCKYSYKYRYIDEDGSVKMLYKDADGRYYYEYREDWWDITVTNIYIENAVEARMKKIAALSELRDSCKKFLKNVVKYARKAQELNYSTYMPYIENVTDHWYRDVYFISNSDVKKFVDYDYEYEAMMKERWTLYETYTDEMPSDPEYSYRYTDDPDKVGEFIVFQIKENGEYLKENGQYVLYNGTFEEARGDVLYEKQENGEYVVYNGPKPGETVDLDGDGQPDQITYPTLYRKDPNGDFIVYNKDTDEPYAVAKKAITVEIKDVYKDLMWNSLGDGVYSAYSPEVTITTDYTLAYESGSETYDDASEEVKNNILSRLYNEVEIGNIVQTGEGQRTETNTKIKKMFLTNKYFRYDGNTETAEIITKLRQDNDIDYGPLEEGDLEKSTTYDGQTYYVKDYAGTVTLNQDSLNQFSILENTHTLDADYIYRDFKELVVELGYFEKEELTDETPRLLEFLIPGIGSAGYPNRTIDKRENEFGTMIHSKYDIDANKKYTLRALMENLGKEGGANGADISEKSNVSLETKTVVDSRFSESTTLASSRVNNGRLQLNSNTINMSGVGAISGSKRPEQIPLQEFLKTTEEMCEFINTEGYNYCVRRIPGEGDDCSCTQACIASWSTSLECTCDCEEVHCHHTVHERTACGLQGSFEESKQNPTDHYDTCCNYLVRWAFKNVGITDVDQHYAISSMYTWLLEELDGIEIENGEPLKPGDICFYRNFAHIDIVAEKDGAGYLKFNGGHPIEKGSKKGNSDSSINKFDGWNDSDPPDHVIRLNWGNQTDGAYEGFLGNEAVVSPVTGILLDYGTYDDNSINNITNEEYRVNVDLKYGPAADFTKLEDDTQTGSTLPKVDEIEKREFSDKVGYAKILVLDKETFEMLESQVSNKWSSLNNGQGLLSDSGHFSEAVKTEDDYEALDDDLLNQTIYGYKEFAELYEKYSIAGNVIYIDGFKCELPDPKFIDSDEDEDLSDENGIPQGEGLLLEDYKKATATNLEVDKITNMYEEPEEYQLPSESATIKLNVEEDLKLDAAPAITIKNPKRSGTLTDTEEILKNLDKLVFIKEGTVLGRTYVDRELVETRIKDWGDDPKYNYEYYNKDEEDAAQAAGVKTDAIDNLDRMIGNYIRIIMRDHDDTVVENVEDYMKLDELKTGDQEYQFQEGDLDLLADAIHHEGCGYYDDPNGSRDDQLYLSTSVGFTIINKLNSDSGYKHKAGLDWAPDKSPLYNLLCVVPCAAHGGDGWYAISDDPNSTLGGIKNRADAGQYEYCEMCMEAAEYIKENDSLNFKNNGKYGSQFAEGEGMPHTCWEQGANYYGNYRIWATFRDDYLFDTVK